jgi:hypothetical protein
MTRRLQAIKLEMAAQVLEEGRRAMSKLEVIAVAILASPVLLHLLKRSLPLKSESRQSVINNFNGPIYFGTLLLLQHHPLSLRLSFLPI